MRNHICCAVPCKVPYLIHGTFYEKTKGLVFMDLIKHGIAIELKCTKGYALRGPSKLVCWYDFIMFNGLSDEGTQILIKIILGMESSTWETQVPSVFQVRKYQQCFVLNTLQKVTTVDHKFNF